MEISKKLFSEYLDSQKYKYISDENQIRVYFDIPANSKSPDFLVWDRKGNIVLCEATEIIKALPVGVGWVDGDFTSCVQDKIEKARKQFKPFKRTNCPCILVLYGSGSNLATRGKEITDAMIGRRAVLVSKNKHTGKPKVYYNVYTTGGKMSHKQKLVQQRQIQNTTISAIAALKRRIKHGKSYLGVDVYHNPWAKNPLDNSSIFNGRFDENYKIICNNKTMPFLMFL